MSTQSRSFRRPATLIGALAAFAAVLAFGIGEATAEQPELLIPVDGVLTDADGVPLDSQVEVTFSLYEDGDTDQAFWSETRQLDVDQGSFATYLGRQEPLTALDFTAHRTPYVAIQIEDDEQMDRWPVGHVPYAAVARHADDADRLQGLSAEELLTGSEATDTDYDSTESNLEADSSQQAIDELAARVDELEQQLAETEDSLADVDDSLEDHDDRMSTLEGEVDDVGGYGDRLDDLEETTAPMSRMDVGGRDSVVFEDVNVHVRSGQGSTDASTNGRGNLIVGYDEGVSSNKTGSHNIVYGTDATYTSYGGLVGGSGNSTQAPWASTIGGTNNISDGTGSVVVSGSSNEATGNYSSVSAGWNNETEGSYSSVVAGSSNTAAGMDSAVVGGSANTATGSQDVVVD